MVSLQGDLTEHLEWLRGLESPFLWKPNLLVPREPNIISHLLQKDDPFSTKTTKVFTFSDFILRLILSYELYATSNNSTAAMLKLDQLEYELNKLDIISNDMFYRQVRRAEWHVVLASRAVLLADMGNSSESKAIVSQNFDPVSTFNSIEMAGLFGIKSSVFMEYRGKAGYEALRWAQEAIKANPIEPEWHLLAGKTMGVIRKFKKSKKISSIPTEEIAYFQKALELGKNENYELHLANNYGEIIWTIFQQHAQENMFNSSELYRDVSEISRRTVEMYQKIIQRQPADSKIMTRCLDGLFKLPRQFLNADEISVILNNVSNDAKKNNQFIRSAAKFYLKIKKDPTTALQFLDEGCTMGDLLCCLKALRLRLKLQQNIDVKQSILRLVGRFKNNTNSFESVLSHLGAYYLFSERNLTAAITTFNKIIEKRPESKAMLMYKPIFIQSLHKLDLFEILLNELRVSEELSNTVRIDPHVKQRFFGVVDTYHKGLFNKTVDTKMIDRILDDSAKLRQQSNT